MVAGETAPSRGELEQRLRQAEEELAALRRAALGSQGLPHNQEAEESVVGGVLFNGRALQQIADVVQASDFYHPALQAVYEAMLELDRQSQPIDIITVAEQMRSSQTLGKLRAYNGEAYLAELANKIATVENIKFHADIVKNCAVRRGLIEIGARTVADGFNDGPAAGKIDAALQRLLTLSASSTEQTTETFPAVLNRTLRRLEQRYNNKQAITGVPTGFTAFDEMTNGLQPGHLWIIAARPAMGKTSLVLNMVMNAACNHGVPALVFTLEMASEELVERALGSEGRIQSERLRSGFLQMVDWVHLSKAGERLSKVPVCLDADTTTLRDLRARARRWRADPRWFPTGSEKRGLIVVDYLQLVEGNARDPREQQIAQISRGLKLLARKLDVAIVALAQVNRACEARADKRPGPADLRESGAIENDADGIAFIYRDEVYNKDTLVPGQAEIIIGKQRNGPTGTVELAFFKPYTRFENLSTREAP